MLPTTLPTGTKVKIVKAVDNFPDVYIEPGETGTIAEIEEDCVWVHLDRPFTELDGWGNQLQIWDWPGEDPAADHIEPL